MSRKQALQSSATPAEQSHRRAHRCYTAAQIVSFLQISMRGFFKMKRRGQLPFLEELRPRLGRTVRYRADLVDRYLAGNWQSVSRSHVAQSATRAASTVSPFSGHIEKEVR